MKKIINKKLKGYPVGTDVYELILKEFTYYKLTNEQFYAMSTQKGIGFGTFGFERTQNVVGLFIPEKQEKHNTYCYFILQYHWLMSILYHMKFYTPKEYTDILHNTGDKYVILFYDNTKSKTDKKMFETKQCIPTIAMAKFQAKLEDYKVNVDKRLNEHQHDEVGPMHCSIYDYDEPHFDDKNVIIHYNNTVYVDINKTYAHGLQLCFPELKDWIQYQYDTMTPETKAYTKSFFNYVVGMMENEKWYSKQANPMKWRKCRWWIVEWCNNEILKATQALKGDQIYLNTDGMMINNPKGYFKTDQKKLGAFKKEQVDNNEVWFTKVDMEGYSKYTILQYFENGEKIVKILGGFQQNEELLKHTDLSKGIIPLFKTKLINGCKVIEFIKEFKLNEKEG